MKKKSAILGCCFVLIGVFPVFAKKAAYTIPADTLVIHLTLPEHYDEETKTRILTAVDSAAAVYNQNNRALKFVRTTTLSDEAVALTWGAPQLAPKKRSYWITGVNALLLGANVLIFPYFMPIIPFYFIPIAKCELVLQEQLEWLSTESAETIDCSAYFRSEEKQMNRLTEAIVEDMDSRMRQWQRHYERYMKRQAKKAQQ